MNDHCVLIASPEPDAWGDLINSLRFEHCHVVAVRTEKEAAQTAQELHPDVVIVDATDNLLDPFDMSLGIRALVDHQHAPVFVFSCCSGRSERSSHLDNNGANCSTAAGTYCFHPLVERVVSYLSQPATKEAEVVVTGGIEIDRGRHRVLASGQSVDVTPTEFRLLWELSNAPGYAFSREDLAQSCLGPNGSAGVRTIDAHIKALRRKLGAYGTLIETVRGIGYRFFEPVDRREPVASA